MGRIAKDRVEEVYGKLTIIERDFSKNSKHGAYWICQCSCGKKLSVLTNNLRSGGTTSCGCGKAEDLSGKTYGEWRVIARDTKKKSVIRFIGYVNVLVALRNQL